jgi:glycosyltransferase involved in cell wall biosynthesis
LLAAVVICRNEERWIETCVRSVLAALESFPGAEVVVVDSCSQDSTVEHARRFPVRVLELQPSKLRSAALGRLVGERVTRSRHVLFVDGDTEIRVEWVRAAVEYLETHPRVGGVAGKLHELYFRGDRLVGENPDCFGTGLEPEEVDQLGGNAIYRRAALDAVGSFNPYIVSYEEAELAERMRQAGSSVVRLPIVLGTHHTGQPGTLAELRRRRRENLIKGYGQALRLGLRHGTFAAHASRMTRYLEFVACGACGVVMLLASIATGDWRFAGAWAIGVGLLIAAFMAKSRSLTKPLRLILDWSIWSGPLVRGFLERPRDPRLLVPTDLIAVEHLPEATPPEARQQAGWARC